MDTQATVTVQRKAGWLGFFRSFKVVVDGAKVAKVKNGKSCSFPVAPGHHEIEIIGSWYSKSQIIAFDAEDGQTINFETGLVSKFTNRLALLMGCLIVVRLFARSLIASQPQVAFALLLPAFCVSMFVFWKSSRRNQLYYLEKLPPAIQES